ncbi:glycosyltransferase family 4 protein [Nocardioides psychrotolerans]|uniref:glycosyltransferase family 4 protein n=1 Tax=Nocardioides psychrotolerans TaxID=1005945 RepID=UPI003137CBD6
MLWITNLAAPYRKPVWEALATDHDLDVRLTSHRDAPDALGRGEDWFDLGSTVYRTTPLRVRAPAWSGNHHLPLAAGVSELVDGADIVVLGGWEAPVYWQFLWAARRAHKPTVGFYESTLATQNFTRGPIARMRELFFRALDSVVTPGLDASTALTAMGVPSPNIYTGFNAVDVTTIHDNAAAMRSGLDTRKPAPHRFLFLGQLVARKNVASLLRAFSELPDSEATLTIVGSGPDRLGLELLAAGLPGNQKVTFLGPVDSATVPSLLARHDTLVLPSTEEVWGLVVNEALAAGLHVVVSRHCGVAHSVQEMRGVFVCESGASSILERMQASTENWQGHVPEPEILEHTPAAMAAVFRKAFDAISPSVDIVD